MTHGTFDDFGLMEPLERAVREEGYEQPTEIQIKAIGHVMAGCDLIGCAQTGTGKTAAFALPILHHIFGQDPAPKQGKHRIRALVISPTRELAAQIDQSFGTYGKYTPLRHTVVFGGVRQGPQVKALREGVEVLTATPGRLLDLVRQGRIKLGGVEILVLDEADRMLDMGFIDDVRKIIALVPKKRQTLLFSATIPSSIRILSDSILIDPITVRVTPERPAAETVEQQVYFVEPHRKRDLLTHVLGDEAITRALVFTRTKVSADRVEMHLKDGNIRVDVLHSDKSQKAREQALEKFKQGKTRVLVASDIASRGLDVNDISHVINFDLPAEPEVYVHRIGRTGRAGATGMALSFCSVEERNHLDEIEKLLDMRIPTIDDHPFPSPLPRRDSSQKSLRTRRSRRLLRRR